MYQHRDFPLKLKALSEEGAFQGFAATYGGPDLVGDTIAPGAFAQSIRQQPPAGYPLLFAHSQEQPLGVVRVEDSKDGLLANGALLMADPAAVRVYQHLKMGSIRGLSIGFTVPAGEGKSTYNADGTRTLREIRLHEISLVAVPANPSAIVTGVKSLRAARLLLAQLPDDQVDGDALGELHEIDRELKRLLLNDPHLTATATLKDLRTFAAELQRFAVT